MLYGGVQDLSHFDVLSWRPSIGPVSGTGVANRKGFAGYEVLSGLAGGKWLARHRVLAAELGRWNRRDPIGYVSTLNLNVYVCSLPVTLSDPDGLIEGDPQDESFKDRVRDSIRNNLFEILDALPEGLQDILLTSIDPTLIMDDMSKAEKKLYMRPEEEGGLTGDDLHKLIMSAFRAEKETLFYYPTVTRHPNGFPAPGNTEANGFEHCVLACELSRRNGEKKARAELDAHESNEGGNRLEPAVREMDLHNNEEGYKCRGSGLSCCECCFRHRNNFITVDETIRFRRPIVIWGVVLIGTAVERRPGPLPNKLTPVFAPDNH